MQINAQQGQIGGNKRDDASNDNTIEVYKKYFDLYTATRDERTSYNKYFMTLLFTDTLFAIFTALLGAHEASAYPRFAWQLLLAAVATAAALSVVWACKLWTLHITTDVEELGLIRLETKMQVPGISEINKDQENEKGVFGVFIWAVNYWGLPLFFAAIFIIIFVVVFRNPSLFSPGNSTLSASLGI